MNLNNIEYKDWIAKNQNPIMRSHHPTKHSTKCYNYVIDPFSFDILHKFFILLNNPDDIKQITEARLFIGPQAMKIKPEQFKSVSEYCYELVFITENTTSSQLMIPLAMIPYMKYTIRLSVFFKGTENIENVQIICGYYDIKNVSRRHILQTLGIKDIETNVGIMRIHDGYIGCTNVLNQFSHHNNDNYDIIHNKLLDEYNKNKLSHGKSFEFIINYQDYAHLNLSKESFMDILEGLSIEWNVYLSKDENSDIWTFYF